ncbi:hypothetical protein AwDysgo_17770 [Bacteroidales bacterium]|nr:hypothetical protein AwDysgo_17770 [Bacteroidales bacterium]
MKKIIVLFTIVLLTITSCSDFFDINDNPNKPANVPVDQLLPNAMVKSMNIEILGLSNGPGVLTSNSLSVNNSLNQLGCVWAGYWSKATNGPNASSFFRLEETYAVNSMSIDWGGYPFWEDTYKILTNYKNIENIAAKDNDLVYVGISKIMQAWHFMRLVDLYNNVPFDDALQGTLNAAPKFESAEDIYAKSINLITAGINDMKMADQVGSKKPANDDIMFKGNIKLWAKFGNTLKLKALIRQSQLEKNAYISQELTKIQEEGSGFLGIGENVFVDPGYISGTTYKLNPMWEKYYRTAQNSLTATYNTLRPTQFLVDKYKSLNDPRLSLIYLAVDDEYIGVPLGATAEYTMAKTSAFRGPQENGGKPAGIYKSSTQPSMFLSSFESLFIQAEAAQRGWINKSSKELYEQAVGESFLYIGASGVEDYLAQSSVALDNASNKIERIIEQKWLSLNSLSGFEAWCDYRRLGIPKIPQSLQSPNEDQGYRPRRLTYRISELSRNRVNVEAQGEINAFESRVFWNK